VLAFAVVIASAATVNADRGAHPRIADCVIFPQWWIGPDGRRMFRTEGGRILGGRIPANPQASQCGDTSHGVIGLNLDCVATLSTCATRVEVLFITASFGILTVQHGLGPDCTPCMIWNAVTVQPESVEVEAATWGGIKQLYR
jgi:hypothetical protein